MDDASRLLSFIGNVVGRFDDNAKRRRFQWGLFIKYIETTGLRALMIVGLLSFLIGAVLTYQSIQQLQRFGAESMSVDFLGLAVLREIAPLLTAVIVAGRTGSSFAAQIGVMKMNQEIDAIRSFGLDPINLLVIPRLWALCLTLPILTFFSMLMGIMGGAMLSKIALDLSFFQLFSQLHTNISIHHFFIGLSKSPVFALLIALVGCFRGFCVEKTSESLGKMTTQAVVESIFWVIVWDALFSIICSYLGY
jgi:phospholipid/cholesterol/gamma-HCH transport system permease protein